MKVLDGVMDAMKSRVSSWWKQRSAIDRRRRRQIALLAALLLMLSGVAGLWVWYLRTRKPLPEILPPAPVVAQVFKPRYLFSIYGVTNPMGVAVTPSGDRIYVTEVGGDRLIHVFDRDGNELFTFAAPGTVGPSRAPVYIDLDSEGNVYVTDRLQHAIHIFTADGEYLDTILAPELPLRDWVISKGGAEYGEEGLRYVYLLGDKEVKVENADGEILAALPAPEYTIWAPLGINVTDGSFYITELTRGRHRIMVLDRENLTLRFEFGTQGREAGQFYYPNDIAIDDQGRIWVSDSNNGRLQVFTAEGEPITMFLGGANGNRMGIPRGLWIDGENRLYVVDTVSQFVHTFRITADEDLLKPLFTFGGPGVDDGEFRYPNDIAVDNTGRLYVTDTYNNRVQVWTY